MNEDELAAFALQRVAVNEGTIIDTATWTDAHAYHQTAQRLHNRLMHGWGIVGGLEVTATEPASRAVMLQPGLAIDHGGNVIRVPQPRLIEVAEGATDTLCLILRFAEEPDGADGTGQAVRMAESYHVTYCAPPVPPGDLEVARVTLTAGTTQLQAAVDRLAPEPGEIDARFRRYLRPQTATTLTIGQLALRDTTANGLHRQGLANVVKELSATSPFVVQFAGDLSAEEAAEQCDLLYICGAGEWPLTPKEGAHLLAFLRRGGVIFAEPCADVEAQRQEDGRFVAEFQRVRGDQQPALKEVGPGHPLFTARYVFGSAPPGMAGQTPILCQGNVILNPNDYGCYWQGGTAAKPLAREPIRAAIELATNVAWYTATQAHAALVEPAPSPRPRKAAASAAR